MNSPIPTIFQNIGVCFKGKELDQMSLSPLGDFAAVGGKRGIFLVDLANPWELQHSFKTKLGCSNVVDFGVLEWNADVANPCIALGNTNLSLWKVVDDSKWSVVSQVPAHRRKISDLAWSTLDYGFLCTCSSDMGIKIWDVRDVKKPLVVKKTQYYPGGPATLVKWNKFDPVTLATAHKGQACIWDLRKTQAPVVQIFADTSELSAIDWSPKDKNILMTATRSTKLKLWSVANPKEAQETLTVPANINKAAFTPFGNGIVVSSKSGLLQIFDVASLESGVPVESFIAPSVTDFAFRCSQTLGSAEYQLISWSEIDEQFRMHPIEPWVLQACKHELSKQQRERMSASPNSKLRKHISEPTHPHAVLTMEEEFDALKPIPGVNMDKIDKIGRELIVSFYKSSVAPVLQLKITFPSAYPVAPPAFTILYNATGTPDDRLKEEVVDLGDDFVYERRSNCVEPCIKLLAKKYILDPVLNYMLPFPSDQPQSNTGSASKAKVNGLIEKKLKELGPGHETYVVSPGDKLASLALMFNMDKIELRKINGIHHSGHLLPGKVLIVKSKSSKDFASSPDSESTPKEPVRAESASPLLGSRARSGTVGMWHKSKSEAAFKTLDASANTKSEIPVIPRRTITSTTSFGKNQWAGLGLDRPTAGVLKTKLSYVVPELPEGFVRGKLTITHNQLIFEPNLDDTNVAQNGVLTYTIVIEMSHIIECVPTTNPSEKKSMLMVGSMEKGGKETRMFCFLGKADKIQNISNTMQAFMSAKREKNLFSMLHLDDAVRTKGDAITKTKSQLNAMQVKTAMDKISGGSALGSASPTSPTISRKSIDDPPADGNGKLYDSGLVTSDCMSDDDIHSDFGVLLETSRLISQEEFYRIRSYLPPRLRDYNWKLLFSTAVDGTSLITFYGKLAGYKYSILLVKDTCGCVFGGFGTEEWRITNSFFGTGESFVFSVKPKAALYKWTSSNEYFMIGARDHIAMGGGVSGRHAIYLDCDFNWGTSEVSQTFLNRRLSGAEEFSCAVVEVWGAVNDNQVPL